MTAATTHQPSFPGDEPCSIGAVLDRRVAATPDAVGWRYPDADDTWRDVTWARFRDRCRDAAAGLLALGVEPGDRVAIAANTRLEWVVADFGNNLVGGVTTTIYPSSTPDDAAYILEHSGATVLLAESPATLARLAPAGVPSHVATIVLMTGAANGADGDGGPATSDVGPRVLTWADFLSGGAEVLAGDPDAVRRRQDATGPETLATLIYTSGTTGRPKGVELTHDAWVYSAQAWASTGLIAPDDEHFLWLPMSHAFGKCLLLICVVAGAQTAVDGRVDRLMANLKELKPTAMCGVPRIFEKVRASVITAVPRHGLKGRAARWSFSVGTRAYPYRIAGRRMPRLLAAEYALADRLIYARLRSLLGGRIRFLISGSAKLSPQVQRWFYSGGIVLTEGYGVTESSAVTFYNLHAHPRFGTVGTIVPGSEARIADDGEILLRGRGIMRGYYRDPERTAETLIDGWLHTGDIGEIDAEGYLRITDRKKDLIKTSTGKYVSPSDVETVLVANCPYVAQAVVAGEGRQYVAALLVLDRDAVARWARRHGRGDVPYAELTHDEDLHRAIDHGVDAANAHLAHWERVRRYAVLEAELTVDEGLVTPNMKVRRDAVLTRFADTVAGLYDA